MENKKRYTYPPYACIRCGLSSQSKGVMHKHLFLKNKSCPPVINEIELTENIKTIILRDRFYRIPVQIVVPIVVNRPSETLPSSSLSLTQHINNDTVIANRLANQDVFEIFTCYTKYTKSTMVDLMTTTENLFTERLEQLKTLDDGVNLNYTMNEMDLNEIFHQISNPSHPMVEKNVIYSAITNTLSIYDNADWISYTMEDGVIEMFRVVQGYLFNDYECYLLRKHKAGNFRTQSLIYEHIIMYFKFLAAFDIEPYMMGKKDNQLIFGQDHPRYDEDSWSDDSHSISEKYQKEFNTVKSQLTQAERNKMKSAIYKRIKSNSIANIRMINSKITKQIGTDAAFQTLTLPFLVNR